MAELRYALLDLFLEAGVAPDGVLRAGSRRGAAARLRRELRGGVEGQEARLAALVERMSTGPIAEATQTANDQHYELPPEFFEVLMGPRMKYSGCLWGPGVTDLAGAEEAMLALACERAGIADGREILDLGCGWGSMALWMAERYPAARILAVSNSAPQRRYIEARRDARGLAGLEVVTADVNGFDPGERRFDRVVSIEMFEHMRNWGELLRRISSWLAPQGRLFVHVFAQRQVPYLFQGTWAADRFFTAGLMPSHELMLWFARDLRVRERWAVSGVHYERTLRAWLAALDEDLARGRQSRARMAMEGALGRRGARRALAQWRLFLISTAEIWGWRGGGEWIVSHYLLEPTRS